MTDSFERAHLAWMIAPSDLDMAARYVAHARYGADGKDITRKTLVDGLRINLSMVDEVLEALADAQVIAPSPSTGFINCYRAVLYDRDQAAARVSVWLTQALGDLRQHLHQM